MRDLIFSSKILDKSGDEYKYVELQNIEPPRSEMNAYELLIATLYSDTEE